MDLTSRRSRARRYAVRRLALVAGVLALAAIAAACTQPSSDAPPSSVAPPVITGTVRVDSTLSTTVGEWAGDPTLFTHQWQSCDAAAPTSCTDVGTGGTDYVVAPSDLGRLVRVRVTGTDATGEATQLSVAVGPILPKLVQGSRAGVWAASGSRQLCGVVNGQQACGPASNVALGFSLVGDCDGIGGCKLTALTGDWDFGLVGGSACLSRAAGGYRFAVTPVSATFTLAVDNTIAVRATVMQTPQPPTGLITDAQATRVGDVPDEPVSCL